MVKSNNLSEATLRLASQKALENARRLSTDAKLLLLFRRHWHAYALLILADEEIAKAYMYSLSKHDPDLLRKTLDHKEKDALIAEGVELWASSNKNDIPFTPSHFRYLFEEKNRALYVDLDPNTGRLNTPDDIPRNKVLEFKREVEGHLKMAYTFLAFIS